MDLDGSEAVDYEEFNEWWTAKMEQVRASRFLAAVSSRRQRSNARSVSDAGQAGREASVSVQQLLFR